MRRQHGTCRKCGSDLIEQRERQRGVCDGCDRTEVQK
jgi:hypothetical protein